MRNKITIIIITMFMCLTTAFAQSTYKVKSGDTLSGIAKKYGVSVYAIQKANPSLGKTLRIGQLLVIPSKSSTSNKRATSKTKESPINQQTTETKAVDKKTSNVDASHNMANQGSESENQSQGKSNNEDEPRAFDWMFQYFTSNHVFSMNMTFDLKHYQYINIIAASSFGDTQYYYFGYGLKKRYIISDRIMLSGHIGPYMGVSAYSTYGVEVKKNGKQKETSDSHVEFAYGLSTELKAGIKLGGRAFLTVGYYTGAPKFKFNNFIKEGTWAVGITAGI